MKICLVTITVGKIALFLLTSFVLELLIFPFSVWSLDYIHSVKIHMIMFLSVCKPDSVATSI